MASAAAAAQRRARPMQLKREEKMKRGRAIEPIEHTHTHNNMPRALCVRVHLPPSIYVWPSPGRNSYVWSFCSMEREKRCYWASLQSVHPGAVTDAKSEERERG
jgi:hypothetical protein